MEDFWNQTFSKINITTNIDKVIKNKENIQLPKPWEKYNENVLHIHIRSGDIMIKNNGYNMVQPPLAYYCNIIEERDWEKIIIVSEDILNPCINALLKKYKNIEYFGKNILDIDIMELLSATNIVSGRGTFIPCLAFFMEDLITYHYPNDGDDRIHYFVEKHLHKKSVRRHNFKLYYKNRKSWWLELLRCNKKCNVNYKKLKKHICVYFFLFFVFCFFVFCFLFFLFL